LSGEWFTETIVASSPTGVALPDHGNDHLDEAFQANCEALFVLRTILSRELHAGHAARQQLSAAIESLRRALEEIHEARGTIALARGFIVANTPESPETGK
jgi:hypothetical protein